VRYLALDVGDRRVGLAVGDDAHGLVRPLRTLVRRNLAADLATISKFARDEEVEALVIGMPLTLRGEEGRQAQRVRRFAAACSDLGLPVELYDERHTTSEAIHRGARDVDAGAATVLLEDFLAQRTR
jgi:putative pre-16S rRNA nuclease